MARTSDAVGQSNGWLFEYAAGLFLFLKNISTVKQIGLEKGEDIVIKKKDNHYIVAQAKSTIVPEDIYRNAQYDNIFKSLDTLSKVTLDSVDEYIMINNFRRPFGNDTLFDLSTQKEAKIRFDNLSKEAKEKLQNYTKTSSLKIDFNKLFNYFLCFETEEPQYYVREVLEAKLSEIDRYSFAKADIVLKKWLNIIENNSRVKNKMTEASLFSGVLFSTLISGSIPFNKVLEYAGLEDESCVIEIDTELMRFFDGQSMMFDVYTNICVDFKCYCSTNSLVGSKKDSVISFVNSIGNVPTYFSDFVEDSSADSLKAYKCFVAYVLIKNSLIDKLKEIFGYAN